MERKSLPDFWHRYTWGLKVGLLVGVLSFWACGRRVAATKGERSKSLSSQREAVVRAARTYLGAPYKYGGTSRKGIDCSGLACQAYREAVGLDLPRSADAQAQRGQAVPLSQAKPGDLVFFREPKSQKVTHVGILVSDGKEGRFIHASTSKGVREDSLLDPHWKSRLVAIRRVLPPSEGAAHIDPPEKSVPSKRERAKKASASAR